MPTYTYDPVSDPLADNGGTYAYGINGSNQVVGGYFLNHVEYGFLDANGVFTTRVRSSEHLSELTAISAITDSCTAVASGPP